MRHDFVRPRVESDHRQPMLLFEQIQRRQGSGFGELELSTPHAVRAIDQQHQIELLALPLALETDREQAFDIVLGITLFAISALARGKHQTATALAHI